MPQDYDIHLDDKFGHLNLMDVGAEAAAHEPWFNQTLTSVNDCVVRLAPERTTIVMVEGAGVEPTGRRLGGPAVG